ncbi:MAG: UDP-N-acetylmuramate dehydrogenase [Firmicutes bacterium]|nr:UDP-N-acetylmuramate dehydrogenase [Bacillota bacterium]
MRNGFAANVPLATHTTYRIGGKAKFFASVANLDELLRAMDLSEKRLILGRGSKVLVSDEGFDGVVIIMRFEGVGSRDRRLVECGEWSIGSGVKDEWLGVRGQGSGAEKLDEARKGESEFAQAGTVYAGAGVGLSALSRFYAGRGLKGLEWACGIPASLGGALKMNAGAYGGDVAGVVQSADVLRGGRVVRLLTKECGFAYRTSKFQFGDVIFGAALIAERGDESEIARLRALYGEKRAAAQPAGYCCGSVFKAAEKPAYTYIEALGLKGICIGGAQISEKHANFILNRGGAKARDVYNLIRTIKAEVFASFGVRLQEEVVYVGEF